MSCTEAPVERGMGWVCSEGHRHFVCYVCCNIFTSSGSAFHDDDDPTISILDPHVVTDPPEDTFSVCDDCARQVEAAWTAMQEES